MKKILFQRRSNAILSPSGVSLGAFLILLALLVAGLRFIFPGMFIAITAPVFHAGSAVTAFATDVRASFANAAALMSERDNLRSQNEALMNENLALTARVSDLAVLLGEAPVAPQGIVAGILSRPPETAYDTLILGAGSTSGVSSGMRVLAQGGVPIGTVDSVTASSARVTLYSSPGRALAAWVGKTRIPLTLSGAGGGVFLAAAPKAAGIVAGDIVYVAGGGAEPIGRVRAVRTNASSPSATLLIAPTVNLFSVVWVTLVP
jgi:cell shape-determining protein MreC